MKAKKKITLNVFLNIQNKYPILDVFMHYVQNYNTEAMYCLPKEKACIYLFFKNRSSSKKLSHWSITQGVELAQE